ncbi:hypothetical protein SFRURICE_001989 [Spodoptera frugiperda]|nr:hypothetical protein SFRURICE_001989 [Spodoptera frugiperda]
MHVMYPEPASQYHSSQPQCPQPEYQPAASPAFQQPAKKRRLLSPTQTQHHNGIPHAQLDNSGYKNFLNTPFIFAVFDSNYKFQAIVIDGLSDINKKMTILLQQLLL